MRGRAARPKRSVSASPRGARRLSAEGSAAASPFAAGLRKPDVPKRIGETWGEADPGARSSRRSFAPRRGAVSRPVVASRGRKEAVRSACRRGCGWAAAGSRAEAALRVASLMRAVSRGMSTSTRGRLRLPRSVSVRAGAGAVTTGLWAAGAGARAVPKLRALSGCGVMWGVTVWISGSVR